MSSKSKALPRVIFDANVIIDLHKYGLWKQLIRHCKAFVTPIIRSETRFYKDAWGRKQLIDLAIDMEEKLLEEIPVSLEEFTSLRGVLTPSFLQHIDDGEKEALSFLYAARKKGQILFCTADLLAIKCLGVLGLSYLGTSLQELLAKCSVLPNFPIKRFDLHSKELFKKMLQEGFQESYLHLLS